MEQEIENILLNSSLTDGEVSRLTNELLNLFSVSNCGGAIPYDSLSDSFKKSIDSIEDNLNK